MTAYLAASYHSGLVPPPDVPTVARALAGDRKVFRMLDRLSMPPFVAALEAWRATTGLAPERTALFTVSGWEPDVPDLGDVVPGHWDERVRFYRDRTSSGGMLRRMPNTVCCHVAVAGKLRGPNAHFVGDGTALVQVVELATVTLESGAVEAAVVVAFDAAEPVGATDSGGAYGGVGASAGTEGPPGVAAACVLTPAPAAPTGTGGDLPRPVPLPAAPATGGSATDELTDWIERAGGVA